MHVVHGKWIMWWRMEVPVLSMSFGRLSLAQRVDYKARIHGLEGNQELPFGGPSPRGVSKTLLTCVSLVVELEATGNFGPGDIEVPVLAAYYESAVSVLSDNCQPTPRTVRDGVSWKQQPVATPWLRPMAHGIHSS